MTVTNGDIDNRERGMDVQTRDPKGADKVRADIARVKGKGGQSPETELEALRDRIVAAKRVSVDARGDMPHCRDCFDRGRDAAIEAIEG